MTTNRNQLAHEAIAALATDADGQPIPLHPDQTTIYHVIDAPDLSPCCGAPLTADDYGAVCRKCWEPVALSDHTPSDCGHLWAGDGGVNHLACLLPDGHEGPHRADWADAEWTDESSAADQATFAKWEAGEL